jgi:tetratricopeptide (TPR) repeat protein
LFEGCCHDVNLIWPYEMLGDIAIQGGDYGQAHDYFSDALRLTIQYDDTRRGVELAHLCQIAMRQGDRARALDYCKDYIKLAYEAETPFNVLERLEMAAKIFAIEGRYYESARLSGAAEALTEKFGRKISADSSESSYPGDFTTRYADASLDALVPDWRTRPDGEAILQAWQDGRALSYDEVVAEALAEL